MVFQWFSDGFPLVLLWFSNCYRWFLYCFPLVSLFPVVSGGFPIISYGFLWLSYGFPMVSQVKLNEGFDKETRRNWPTNLQDTFH